MCAKHTSFRSLDKALRETAGLAQIKLLATPNLLNIADADSKPPLLVALEHHNDPVVTKLLISRHPQALGTYVGGMDIWTWFQTLPTGFLHNRGRIGRVLLPSYEVYKEQLDRSTAKNRSRKRDAPLLALLVHLLDRSLIRDRLDALAHSLPRAALAQRHESLQRV